MMEFLETATGGKAVAHQNYLFKLKSSKDNYSWWACKLSTCNAKLTIKDYNLVIAEKGTHAHNNNCHEIKALQCLQQIKKRTLEDIMTPITTIYRLNIGWSVHTGNLLRKVEVIPQDEIEMIENVIRRANEIEKLEVERVGRMLCRLENMTKNTIGDGKKSCSMCGTAFGLFGSFIYCVDCKKAVCEKCRVDILTTSPEFYVLCKICSENREVWKKSGGWFYGKFPTLSEDIQKECISQIAGSPGMIRAFNTWEHRARDIVRLESFEPPEENRNENTLYKDWATKSTLDLSTLDEDDLDYVELESFRKPFSGESQSNTNLLTVQSCHLSSSCPALAELQEPPKLIRKATIRRKKRFLPLTKNVKKYFKTKETS